MKSKTLEKFFEYIFFVSQYPHDDSRQEDLRDELRALVKAESEPSFLDEYADEFYNHGGEPRESDVQAEGRGEIPAKIWAQIDSNGILREVFSARPWSAEDDPTHGFLLEYELATIKEPLYPKPHNPDNLPSPGEGYRFLDEDEIGIYQDEGRGFIEFVSEVSGNWLDNGSGRFRASTYRTRLTREQLAQKRKEAGK